VLVACLVCLAVLGPYLFYGQVDASLRTPREWLWVPAIGAGGGLLGGLFARAVLAVLPRVTRLGRRRPYAVAGSLGLMLAVLGLLSDGATYGAGDAQTHAVLLRGEALPWTYPLAKAAASFVCLISAIPGGLFTPSLSVGAALGSLLVPLAGGVPREAIVLLAMAAYFGGVVQSPITAALIVVEMTGGRSLVLPLLATTLIAFQASRLVCPTPIYEALAQVFVQRTGAPAAVSRGPG
jgi:H+/Cl- antiporter ClcA